MKQIISLSIVSIALFDTAEMRRMNRALVMYYFDDVTLNRLQTLKQKISLTDQTGTNAPTTTIFLKRDKVIRNNFPHNRIVAKRHVHLFCLYFKCAETSN